MRHRKAGTKLNMSSSHRDAMFRNMVTSLLKHDRIRTTNVRAKELRRWADHIITLAKRGDLHARRQALAIVREKDVVHKLFEEAEKRFGKISGGYTRITKLGRRPGDAAPVSIIELISTEEKPKKKKAKAPKKTPADQPIAAEKAETPEATEATAEASESEPVEEKAEIEAKEADVDAAQAGEAAAPQDAASADAQEAVTSEEADPAAEAEDAPEEPSEKKED
jgi:large subunit ribosomal protein L17